MSSRYTDRQIDIQRNKDVLLAYLAGIIQLHDDDVYELMERVVNLENLELSYY